MIKILTKLFNTGVISDMSDDTVKRIKIINIISIISFSVCLFLLCHAIQNNWPPVGIISYVAMLGIVLTPLYLNSKGKSLMSRIFYLFSSNIIILYTCLLYGLENHFQYYLFIGIGIPLVLLENNFGLKRLLISIVTLLLWIYLEWHYSIFEPLIPIESTASIRTMNDIIILFTVFGIVYLFVLENNKNLKAIHLKTENLNQANSSLDQFAYTVSHDLKAPLRNISSLIAFAKEDFGKELNPEMLKICSTIEEKAKKSQHLIDSILSYSKAGNAKNDITTFNLQEVLADVNQLLDFPQGFEVINTKSRIKITGSRIQLQQVLTNIIGNAVKYHHDSKNGKILILTEPINDNTIQIVITDNGPGIKKELQGGIFDLFNSGDNSARFDSTGIGLAIVKKLVEKNGGTIQLISADGEGATFKFTWPINNL